MEYVTWLWLFTIHAATNNLCFNVFFYLHQDGENNHEMTLVLFFRLTYSNGTMVTGPAGNKQQASAAPDFCHMFFDATEYDLACFKVDTSTHCVHHRLWLLEDFFLHEGAVVAWGNRRKWINNQLQCIMLKKQIQYTGLNWYNLPHSAACIHTVSEFLPSDIFAPVSPDRGLSAQLWYLW